MRISEVNYAQSVVFLLFFFLGGGGVFAFIGNDLTLLYYPGKKLPNPTIKSTKKIGDTLIHKLCWGDENGGDWVGDDFFKLLDDNGEVVSNLSSCNTRKSRDKRQNVHSVGVFTGAYPCGVIVLGNELYTSESISQVYGILTDFVSSLSDGSKLKQLLYDDMTTFPQLFSFF